MLVMVVSEQWALSGFNFLLFVYLYFLNFYPEKSCINIYRGNKIKLIFISMLFIKVIYNATSWAL